MSDRLETFEAKLDELIGDVDILHKRISGLTAALVELRTAITANTAHREDQRDHRRKDCVPCPVCGRRPMTECITIGNAWYILTCGGGCGGYVKGRPEEFAVALWNTKHGINVGEEYEAYSARLDNMRPGK